MKKILHPTDFSTHAAQALKFAYALAQKFTAELTLLHVGDLPTIMSSPEAGSFEEMEDLKRAALLQQLQAYATQYLGSTPAGSLLYEARLHRSALHGLLDALGEQHPDLVVMGTRGHSRFHETLMGSTTRRLIAEAPCPVLAVPEGAEAGTIRRIVYASDFDPVDAAVVKKAAEWAQRYEATLTVLHVFKKDQEKEAETAGFEQQLTAAVPYAHLAYDIRVADHPVEAIGRFAREDGADLLVLYEREHRSLVDRLFHKDPVRQYAVHTTIPLLSYNKRALGIGIMQP